MRAVAHLDGLGQGADGPRPQPRPLHGIDGGDRGGDRTADPTAETGGERAEVLADGHRPAAVVLDRKADAGVVGHPVEVEVGRTDRHRRRVAEEAGQDIEEGTVGRCSGRQEPLDMVADRHEIAAQGLGQRAHQRGDQLLTEARAPASRSRSADSWLSGGQGHVHRDAVVGLARLRTR